MLANASETFTLELNGNKNVLPHTDFDPSSGSGTFTLEKGSQVGVDYEGYIHYDANSWGHLISGGHFENTHGIGGRVGGLTSISYSIGADLTIHYGYDNYSTKEFYHQDTLSKDAGVYNFPTGESPDRFKIVNNNNEQVWINSMTFTYSCNHSEEHNHVDSSAIGRTGSTGSYVYKHICDICGEAEGSVVDLHAYKVKIGTSENDLVTYDPYNYDEYADSSRAGTLDFDYNETLETGTKRFVLTLSGDNALKNIYIDSNVANSQIFIKSQSNASIHDITFKGGNGVLLFTGEKLTLVNGNLTTEAKVTSVKGPLSFEDTRKTKDAITVSNGAVYLENDVNITGYNVGVRLSRNLTGQDLHQTGGTFTIKNTDRALVSKTGLASGEYDGVFYLGSTALFEDCTYALSFGASFDITGNVTIKNCEYGTDGGNVIVKNYLFVDSCYHGLHHTNIQVGDDNNSGKLHIYVDDDDAKSDSDRACGIYAHNTNTINFYKGKAAIFGYAQNTRTSAIKVGNNEGWSNSMFSVSSNDFVYGFGNIKYGFDCESNATQAGQETFSNSSTSTFKYYGVGDIAWYCGKKPTGTLLNSIDEFKSIFEI